MLCDVCSTDKSKTVIADSGGQDSTSSPDVVHLDIVEEGYDNQHNRTDVDHKGEMVCDVFIASPFRFIGTRSTSSEISPSRRRARKLTRALMTARWYPTTQRRRDRGRKKR